MAETFVSHLRVDKQIVPLLSKSTYQKNFSNAIRELVSNAYDADALTVRITISQNFSKIEIEDDGSGMTREEFDHYCTIAGLKRDIRLSRKYNRKRIGQFGIGFLSVFPFCEFLEVTTTVENSDEIITARIPARKYFEYKGEDDVSKIPINGSIIHNGALKSKQFTRIALINPTNMVRQYFSNVKTRERKTIKKWDPMTRFRWELQEDLPISFDPKSPFNKVIKYDEPIGIKVLLNGEPLYRNELSQQVLASGIESISGIECQYIITTSYAGVEPVEARGLKIRLNNVGIGRRSYLNLQSSRGFSRLHWLTGDVLISDRLRDDLNISRDNFVSTRQVDNFFEGLRNKLREWAYYVEDVGEAEKELQSVMANTQKTRIEPRHEIISENIEKLKKRGFTVVTEPEGSRNSHSQPISVDKASKTVTISNIDVIARDEMVVFGRKMRLVYKKWDYKSSDMPSCRFGTDGSIEINQTYPLFESKQYGHMFKKIFAMLLLAQENSPDSAAMLHELMKRFLKEFKDLAKDQSV